MKYIYRVSNMEKYDSDKSYYPLFFTRTTMDSSVSNTFDESKKLKHFFLRPGDAYAYNYLSLNEVFQTNRINVFSVSEMLLEGCYGETTYDEDGEKTIVEEVAIPQEKLLKYMGHKDTTNADNFVLLTKQELQMIYLGYVDLDTNEMVYFNEYLRNTIEDENITNLINSIKEPIKKVYTNEEQ